MGPASILKAELTVLLRNLMWAIRRERASRYDSDFNLSPVGWAGAATPEIHKAGELGQFSKVTSVFRCDPSTLEIEPGGLPRIQVQPALYRKFQASQGYIVKTVLNNK